MKVKDVRPIQVSASAPFYLDFERAWHTGFVRGLESIRAAYAEHEPSDSLTVADVLADLDEVLEEVRKRTGST